LVEHQKPIVAITMGDPCGIGPEVVAKALSFEEIYALCNPIVVGSAWCMEQAVKLVRSPLRVRRQDFTTKLGIDANTIDVIDPINLNPDDVTPGQISPTCGRAAMEWVSLAAKMAIASQVDAIATAPINKEAASLAGFKAIGHMELLQELSGSPTVATMLMSGRLRVVHLTTHKPLSQAVEYVTKERILSFLELTHHTFAKWGMPRASIGVAALNPHASDGGVLGHEEASEIIPAVKMAQKKGINATGPIPADIVFHQAIRGSYDVVLAMYHDQGHIPIKVYGFDKSITANLGLPFVRTSVDHGTAFDIAGKGVATHSSMLEAINLAVCLSTGNGLPQT
jgi:4-hydroxythreonine-4-phosphate dehydrogenase